VGSEVKERLTGAIILVALIVLLVPELLKGPVRVAPRAAAAPAADEASLRSYTINLADDAHAHGAQPSGAGPEPPVPVDAGAAPAAMPSPAARPATAAGSNGAPAGPAAPGAAPPAPPVRVASAATAMPVPPPAASAPAAGAAGAAAAGTGTWMVQLGSFASRANAERLAKQVRSGGFRVSVSQGSSGRHLYRVRVGPVRDREAATQLATRLQAAGHGGAIVPK
jgi:cell division septation protein DedD